MKHLAASRRKELKGANIVVGIDLAITGKHVAIIRQANRTEITRPIRFTHTVGDMDGVWKSILGTARSRMTKAGPSELKRSPYIAADVARKFDRQLAQIYWTDRTVKGHPHTQAVCAVATHLAARLYNVLRSKAPYELWDLDGAVIDKTVAEKLVMSIAPNSESVDEPEQSEIAPHQKRRVSALIQPFSALRVSIWYS